MNIDTIKEEDQKKTTELQDKILISVKLAPHLNYIYQSIKTERKDFKQLLTEFLDDFIRDLAIPLDISVNIVLGNEYDDFHMVSFQITINNQKARIPLEDQIQKDIQSDELAKYVIHAIYKNRNMLITPLLSEKILDMWSDDQLNIHDFPKNIIHETITSLINKGVAIKRIPDFFKEQNKTPNVSSKNINLDETIFGLDIINLEILLSKNQYNLVIDSDKNNETTEESQKQTTETKNGQSFEDMLSMMHEGLFYELGIFLPKVSTRLDHRLEKNEYRIKLNDLRFPPMNGLDEDHFLINDTVERLRLLTLSGIKAINPANKSECAIVKGKEAAKICEQAGLTSWDTKGYIILSLSDHIRRNASAFLSDDTTNILLDRLKRGFPSLYEAISKHFTLRELTLILRDFLDEQLSIRNLRGILEELIAIEIRLNSEKNTTDTLIKLVELLRISLKQEISYKYGGDTKTLIVFLLDPSVEATIQHSKKLSEDEKEYLIKAIYDKIGRLTTAKQLVILTTFNVRKKLRKLTEIEFAKLGILCYEELSYDMNIQPLDRITLN